MHVYNVYNVKFALFQVYTYSGLLLLILLAEFGAGIAALVSQILNREKEHLQLHRW